MAWLNDRCLPWLCIAAGLIVNLALAAPLSAQVVTRPPAAKQTLSSGDTMHIKFKATPRTDAQVVRVGDLVEVLSWGKRELPELLDMPLAPAPAVGKTQEWTSHEVMRQLVLRGIPQGKLRWSGSESASLMRVAPVAAVEPKPTTNQSMSPAYVQQRVIEQAEANVIDATREYLWLQTGDRTQWHISLEVPPEHAAGLAQRRSIVSIAGGEAPWIGAQQMKYLYKVQDQTYELELVAEVEPPQMVVVASRPIRRDEVIEETALAYAPLPDRQHGQVDEYFQDFEQVVGKQLRRSLSSGLPIPKFAVGEPIVISSGELIEIESVSGSVSVKTSGRALSGGAVGELINVEVLPQRKRMTATVVGPLQVRISGGSARSTTSTSNDQSGATWAVQTLDRTTSKQAQRPLEGIRR